MKCRYKFQLVIELFIFIEFEATDRGTLGAIDNNEIIFQNI